MEPAIRFDSVSKSYRGSKVLDAVDLHVPAGSIFALLGENGAGKTTAIHIMLGMTRPDQGTSQVLGLSSQKNDLEIRRRVGYVAERPQLYSWMSVDEIGWFAAGFYPDGYFDRYSQLIQSFDVARGKRIDQLSKGMIAKVALSLALAHDPDVLILDEPTSGLDPVVRHSFLESIVDRAATGKTVLLASHQINEVERVADYVAMLRNGKIVLSGKLDDLRHTLTRLDVSVRDTGIPLPPLNGQLIAKYQKGRQWTALIRDLSAEQIQQIRDNEFVVAVNTQQPHLEEIYLAFAQHSSSAVALCSTEEST